MSFRIIAAFVIFLFGMRVNAQTVMPSEPLSKALTIFELPPFERAVCCIKYYEERWQQISMYLHAPGQYIRQDR